VLSIGNSRARVFIKSNDNFMPSGYKIEEIEKQNATICELKLECLEGFVADWKRRNNHFLLFGNFG
jgi:hypothetical protein